jgi:predicted nucleic acid-binding protein
MTLADAGPLVALIDSDEADHAVCVRALARLSRPLVTTWPAFTEAMYLLGRVAGWHGQDRLWQLVRQGDLLIECPDASMTLQATALMSRYRDAPMDLADATLVAFAEARGLRRIFTLDRHFATYQLTDRTFLEITPSRS